MNNKLTLSCMTLYLNENINTAYYFCTLSTQWIYVKSCVNGNLIFTENGILSDFQVVLEHSQYLEEVHR